MKSIETKLQEACQAAAEEINTLREINKNLLADSHTCTNCTACECKSAEVIPGIWKGPDEKPKDKDYPVLVLRNNEIITIMKSIIFDVFKSNKMIELWTSQKKLLKITGAEKKLLTNYPE